MKKYIFILFTTALLYACTKERQCWILNDCIGNDIGNYCGTEAEVQKYCRENETPGCALGYRPD